MKVVRTIGTAWLLLASVVFFSESRTVVARGDGYWTCNGQGYGYSCEIENADESAACSACPAEGWCPGVVWYDDHTSSASEGCQGYESNWRNGCQCTVL